MGVYKRARVAVRRCDDAQHDGVVCDWPLGGRSTAVCSLFKCSCLLVLM